MFILFQIWLAVFLLINGLSSLVRRRLPQLRPLQGSLLTTLIMVPCMVHLIIPLIYRANGPQTKTQELFPMNNNPSRYSRGLDNLKKIDGQAGESVIDSLKDIAPDLARYVIEYAFGDIYNRPQLGLREREIATIAALTAMGNAQPQLKVHIQAGLNVGLSQQEIVEIITQMSVYSGFPGALNGIEAAKSVFGQQS
jgi:4-carboxymuconolactone decarboxylase